MLELKQNQSFINPFSIFLLALMMLGLWGCKSGGDDDGEATNGYQVRGTILNEQQAPVAEASVSIDGIEAVALTDVNGRFVVESEEAFDESAVVTVTRDGFDAYSSNLDISAGTNANQYTISNITLSEASAWEYLDVSISPVAGTGLSLSGGNSIFSSRSLGSSLDSSIFDFRDGEACDCKVNAKGRVYKRGGKKSKLYVMFAVDVSGSTGQKYIGEQTVFEVEIQALKTLLDNLRGGENTYIGVITFATNASLMLDFTDDMDAVARVLSNLNAEPVGSTGATNYQDALNLINDSFADKKLHRRDIQTVAFVSDGIPTAPVGSGITQEKGDRLAAIFAADDSATQDVHLNTFPVNIVSKLTTMPALSAMTDGIYFLHDPDKIATEIANDSLIGILDMVLENETTGAVSTDLKVFPDGRFDGNICLAEGKNKLKITPSVCVGCEKISYQKINATCEGEKCDTCLGNLIYLKLKYLGDDDVDVKVTTTVGDREVTVFDDEVDENEVFGFRGAERDKTMGDTIKVYVDGDLWRSFRTTCGQIDIRPGLVSGDFEVIDGYSRNGGRLCPAD